MLPSRRPYLAVLVLLLVPLAGLMAAASGKKTGYTGQLQAKHLDENMIAFIRPGITVKIVSAAIAQDGTITARFTIADPKGLALDKDGITTPGAVSLRFIAATIPAGKTQYLAYTTTVLKATLNSNPSQTQAAADSGGTFTKNADGDYTYTFKTKAPANFDATATHAIGVYAVRDLSEFMTYEEWSEASNDVYNFVPSGAPVTVTRSITPTTACNQCHNPLFGHGGSRLTVEMCILCHTPQTVNPDTELTQDMPVLIHKIHMGANLPSVQAGTPYRIWHRGAWSDFSTVAFPQDVRNCTVCHQNAPQADNWKTKPSRAVCGSCHDNVNFATGENHVDLPQISDNECANCHNSTQTLDFDASIPGAHVIPEQSKSLPGLVTQILKVDNATPGSAPTVTFSVTDKAGNPMDITNFPQARLVLAGPNVDYQTGAAGLRVTEDVRKAPSSGGQFTYTMTNKIPDGATGSYTISMEARNSVTLLPGTKKETIATDAADPVEFYFSVDSSPVAPRRVVVSTEKCAACHQDLKFIHGGTRNNTQECTLCHNPTLVDGTSNQSVNFAWMVHAIHRGEGLSQPYTLGSVNYQEVLFPGDTRDCNSCHVNGSYNPENVGAQAMVATTGGYTPTTGPIAAACQACHDDQATASHALTNTSTLGEACAACHSSTAEFSMDKVHSRTK